MIMDIKQTLPAEVLIYQDESGFTVHVISVIQAAA